MLGKVLAGTAGAAVAVGLLASPAAADRPTRETVPLVGEQVICGTTVLTVVSGSSVDTVHQHTKKGGLVQEVFRSRPKNVVLEDEAGNTYRAVGSLGGQFTGDTTTEEGAGFGHFSANITILGERGKFGDVRFRLQVKRNGEVIERDTGSCSFPD